MFSNIRSLIFKLDPETAHNLAIKSLKFNFVPNILDENKNDPLFKTKLFGKRLLKIQLAWQQDLIKMQRYIILYLN